MVLSTEASAAHLLAYLLAQFLLITKIVPCQDCQTRVAFIGETGSSPGKPPEMYSQGRLEALLADIKCPHVYLPPSLGLESITFSRICPNTCVALKLTVFFSLISPS